MNSCLFSFKHLSVNKDVDCQDISKNIAEGKEIQLRMFNYLCIHITLTCMCELMPPFKDRVL